MSEDERRFHIFCNGLLWLSVILLALVFLSCSPCKRLSRLSSKHPYCLKTITIRDTVRIPEVKADTIFQYSQVRDTVVLQKDRLTVRYYHNDSTVYLSGECRDSTVVIEKVVNVPAEKENGVPWWAWLCLGIAGTTVLYVVRGRKG